MYRKGQKTIGNVYEEVGMPPRSQNCALGAHMLADPHSYVHALSRCCALLQVAMLFRSHKDLLEEFTYFLPDAQAPAQASYQLQELCLPMAATIGLLCLPSWRHTATRAARLLPQVIFLGIAAFLLSDLFRSQALS